MLIAFTGVPASQGATKVTTATGGNWNSSSTWAGGVVPTNTDAAVILAGASVTVTANATVSSLVFSNNNSSTATLTVNSGIALSVTAGITNQNSATTNTAVLIQGGGSLACAALTVGGTTTPTPTSSDFTTTLTSTISNLSISGNLTVEALYNSTQSAANQGTFALSSGAVSVGGSVVFVTVPLFGPTLTLATGSQNGTLTLSGSTPFSITGGGSSTFTANGANATVNYSGTAQMVQTATYQNLILSGSGTKTTTGVTVNGTLFMCGTATASAAPTYGANATLEYNGSATQTTGPELSTNVPNVLINNSNGVTLASSPTITGTLTLASGILTTGTKQINLATNGSVSGGNSASYVNGSLQKTFSVGTQTFTFPIGSGSSYAPVALSNLSVTVSGSLMANTTAGIHPQLGSGSLDTNRLVNRYWTLTNFGGTFGTYNATFNYSASDVDATANPAEFVVQSWNGSAWSGTTINGTTTTNSTSIASQIGFGDFAIGNYSLSWYSLSWPYRLSISVDHTKVAGPLTNFPVLVSLTNTLLQQSAMTNGYDLLFTSSNGTSKLAHEIESYTSSNGTLVAWVKVPLLSSTTDTVLYLYYGNPASTNQQNATNVWDSNYVGVWHLNQTPTGSTGDMADSTSVGNAGTSQAITAGSQVAGQIGGSLTLSGTSSNIINTSVAFTNPITMTVQAWVKTISTEGNKVVGLEDTNFGTKATMSDRLIYVGTNGYAYFGTYNTNNRAPDYMASINIVNDGQWHYLVGYRDNSAGAEGLYVDGVLQGTTNSTAIQAYTGWYRIGGYRNHAWPASGTDGYFAGSVDEVRVSHSVRSASWVSTEYQNQSSPATFLHLSQQTPPATHLVITSLNGGSSPSVGAAFSIVVQAQDESNVVKNVQQNTVVSLILTAGTGTLGGTLTGTIPAGTNSVTFSGLTYSMAQSGVSLTASEVSGDTLAAGSSGAFTVVPGNQTISFSSPGNQTYGVGPITLSASASSGLPVSYSVTSGSATVSSNQLTITGAGSITIQASQVGNTNWNAATPTNQTISVAQKTVIGSITVNNKTYDATVAATIATRTLSGVTNSDVVSLTGGTATFADKNVGTGKTVIATGLSLSGTNAGNYVLASTSATNTANITKAALTVSATGVNKTYDGTTNATVTLSDNRLTGDSLSTSYTSASFADKNVGTNKTVSVFGIAISGTDSGNYSANTNATTTANITKATLTVTATGINKTYDGTTNATVTLSDNRLAGDSLTTSYASASFADKNVGTNKTVSVSGITISGTDSGNYSANITATTTANITKANLTVTATGVNKTYDGTTNAIVTLSDNRLAGDSLTTSYASAGFADKNVGNNKIVSVSGITVSGTDSGNYSANTTATTTASIIAATILVSANNTNRPYGTPNPVFTASYSGFVNGEGVGVISGSPVLTTTATTNSPVGVYPIQISQGTLSSANYTFSLTNGTLTVTAVAPVLTISLATDTEGQTEGVSLSCAGLTPTNTYYLEASMDLLQWQQIATLQAASDGTITYPQTNLVQYPTRFYRLSGN